ncbi:glutathione peroxidase [Bdellovibrio bacteriovorus]|uniref:Glutathione peroxidase n=1 Tax=Bdellovibrio bacteriovorus TaxID=959 RepID=A0A1Z3NBU9_BDEBC|nr:glutathione peroxidase [Bdellovibrio bacteriovorus]ASD64917.1 glutathione peroxidase [Bdellovibrio bacteriovorus]
MKKHLYDFTVKAANGQPVSLDQYRDKVVLVVNVASKCGYTPQYKGLEELYQQNKDNGLVILGFPCNQFGAQEPGSNEEIQQFCELNYGVSFPVMGKVEVNGGNADPLYQWMKEEAPGLLGTEMIKWNFTKFLIGKDGTVLKRFAPKDEPKDIADDIKKALA